MKNTPRKTASLAAPAILSLCTTACQTNYLSKEHPVKIREDTSRLEMKAWKQKVEKRLAGLERGQAQTNVTVRAWAGSVVSAHNRIDALQKR